jgi:membrane-bound serine protease (ClpP class)
MLRLFCILLLALTLVLVISAVVVAQTPHPSIYVIEVKGTINPVLHDYISRGIDQAEKDNVTAVIIQMDTPGGLDTATRNIIQKIVNSRVPVVVYVSPSGARAASAGLYITLSAHVAAMAPNTAIGAATPVSLGSEGQAQEVPDELKQKIINDAAAYIRSLAESRGRNPEWAERAVREGVSITEQEALRLNVIDLVSPDLNTLIAQLNGRTVTMLDGRTVTLQTTNATIIPVKMRAIESFLYTIADPNIAFLLLSIATLGIMVEIFNPGLIFPGIVGAISGILAFYALGQLPVNIAGILLIVLAVGLFVGEALTASFGLFTTGGIISLVVGALILFQGQGGNPELFRVDPWLIAFVTILLAGIFAFVISRVIRAHRRQATTGREELIGKTAVARTALKPEGSVFFKGERWLAVMEKGQAEPGEEVVITRVDGLKLHVTKKEK